jgi:hypothetical protein
MLGALVGGLLFDLYHVRLGFGEIKITLDDLIATVVGSFGWLFAVAALIWGRSLARKRSHPSSNSRS